MKRAAVLLGAGRRLTRASIGLAVAALAAAPGGLLGLALLVGPVLALLAWLGISVPLVLVLVGVLAWLAAAPLMLFDSFADAVSRGIFRMRLPGPVEERRLSRRWYRVCRHAGVNATRFHLRIDRARGVNAAAGARTIVGVTAAALALPDPELDAILAHELGHHVYLHAAWTAISAWLLAPLVIVQWIVAALVWLVHRLPFPLGPMLSVLVAAVVLLIRLCLLPVVLVRAIASRAAEHEADAFSARQGNGRGLLRVLSGFASSEARTAPDFASAALATHPPSADRIQRVREVLADGRV